MKRIIAETARRCPLFVVGVGDWAIVGLPAESFIARGLAVRAASPAPFSLAAAYFDCTLWYIPTRKSMRDGGYESARGWRYTAAEAGEQIAGAVARRRRALRAGG